MNSDPEVDSDCTCDKVFIGGGGGGVFGGFDAIFRSPSIWTSSARFQGSFFEPSIQLDRSILWTHLPITSVRKNKRLSQACPLFLFASPAARWTSAGSPSQELPSGESSDDCARGGDTSRSRSLRPWPRLRTTQPYGDRRRPGPGEEVRVEAHGEVPEELLPQPELFSLYDEEPGGRRPPCLGEPPGLPERVQRHTVVQLADVAPMVQILDVPVPQMADQLVDVLELSDAAIPEQVIAVPKISQDSNSQRLVLSESADCRVSRSWSCAVHWSRWTRMVPGPDPVGPSGGINRQPRVLYKYWARMTWCTSDAGYDWICRRFSSSTDCQTFQL